VGDAPLQNAPWDCADGDPGCDLDGAVDGSCDVAFRVCVGQTVAGCTPDALTKLKLHPRKLAKQLDAGALDALAQASDGTCSELVRVTLPLRRDAQQPSKRLRAKIAAKGTSGRGKARLRARCVSAVVAGQSCGVGAAPGTPVELELVHAGAGSDLDVGWHGSYHDFALPSGRGARFCLSGCDATTDPLCDLETAPDLLDASNALLPPMPLLAVNVPTCVVSRPTGAATGTFDLATGALEATVPAALDFHFLTPLDEVCPRCNAGGGVGAVGTCSASAARAGETCVVDGVVQVPDSAGDSEYRLSRDCLPAPPTPEATIELTLPLTTATSSLTGAPPLCPGPGLVEPKANSCTPPGTCGASCAGPDTCPTTDASGRCIAAKGGIAQACCTNDPERPCFAGSDSGAIHRYGSPAGALLSPWPDAGYPKTGDLVLAGTACFPSVTSVTVDVVSGLPGPAAFLMPVEVVVKAAE